MFYLLLFQLAFAIDLTALQLDSTYTFNHSAQFKTQLQMDYTVFPLINPMPQNQYSDETRMNQIIYEQEERAVEKEIKISDEPAPSPYKIKYEEIPEDEKPQTKAKLPRKRLQEETLEGEPLIDFLKMAPLAQRHKITILVFFILLLCVFILMREMYFKSLHKIFRQYLWKITIESMYSIFVIIIMIAVYYNNYFDFWLLNSQYQQEQGKEDILLIEIHDYDENYKFNIYAYILIAGLVALILYFLQFMQIFIFDKQMELWKESENKWHNKHQFVSLYIQQQEELAQKKQLLQQFHTLELKKEIEDIEITLKRAEKCMDYLYIKLQFLYTMAPYLGPNKLSDSFSLHQYLGYICASSIYQMSLWDSQQCFNILLYLFAMVCMLYFINIIIVSILVCIILFVKIINLNYSIMVIKEKCLIKKEIEKFQEIELIVAPPFMDPIFENILPKRAVDIQSDLFPFANKYYYVQSLSTLFKTSTTLIFIINVYFVHWQHYNLYVTILCNIICISTWISIFYISINIIEQYTIIASLFIRNYEFVYNVCKNQKILLIEACSSFYELMRFIKKQTFQQPLQKENLLLLRPCIIDIIEICKQYQQKGVAQAQFDPREIELVDMGIESMDLIPKKYLKEIVGTLTENYTEQDLVYIDNFCSDANPNYFSPVKLNLYLHLRQQETMQNSRTLLHEVLEKVIPMTYANLEQIEGDLPNDYVQEGLKGFVDLNVLDNFLQESVKSNYFKQEYRQILIQELTRLKSKKVDEIANFICDQISQLPL